MVFGSEIPMRRGYRTRGGIRLGGSLEREKKNPGIRYLQIAVGSKDEREDPGQSGTHRREGDRKG